MMLEVESANVGTSTCYHPRLSLGRSAQASLWVRAYDPKMQHCGRREAGEGRREKGSDTWCHYFDYFSPSLAIIGGFTYSHMLCTLEQGRVSGEPFSKYEHNLSEINTVLASGCLSCHLSTYPS